MTATIDYYFAIQSPFAYLGSRAFDAIVEKSDAQVNTYPIDLFYIFPKTGGVPVAKRAPVRQAYRLTELKRWSEHRGMKLVLKPTHFPVDVSLASRMVIAADRAGADARALAHAFLAVTWAEDGDVSDADTLARTANALDMDGPALRAAAEADVVGETYEATTLEALERGVFGSPTYIVGDEMFWGQDRLDFVERALA
jgi:2-hydroxychromene-2-carboxylate isomerase